ncbi:hypothetical protein ACHAXA_003399 [Cyclostephanos tholiformis]|jgi:hypothetical protein|uniref:ER-bound oxygenase mpaB/mpaB'/Rubber oxygenase catalytic domain-containing protein n=1 Tax=Cyclostephanos tholiformis TaxID=382380 RepID=A0ABD3REU1_9STRA
MGSHDGNSNHIETSMAAALVGIAVLYLTIVRFLRYRNYDHISRLPRPKTEAEAHLIFNLSQQMDFPFLSRKSLEFGLFKTYAIPSISKLLVATKQLTENTSRRYDDTDLIMCHMNEDPIDSPLAQLALRRLNEIHGNYVISNEDYLYVLSVFIVEPARWIERYGFRSLHRNELDSFHLKYMNIGIQMGIQKVPKTFEEAADYMDSYEEKYMTFHPANAKLAASTQALFLSTMPSIFHPLAQKIVHALCPPRLRVAMEFPEPPVWACLLAHTALAVAQLTHRHLLLPRWRVLRRTQPWSVACPFAKTCDDAVNIHLTQRYTVFDDNYPNGYKISMLGPLD